MAEQNEDRIIRKFDGTRLMKQTKMPVIVIYNHPTDYPDKYVARVWDVNKPTQLVALADTLEEIREAIPDGMVSLGRRAEDDPCITEVWI